MAHFWTRGKVWLSSTRRLSNKIWRHGLACTSLRTGGRGEGYKKAVTKYEQRTTGVHTHAAAAAAILAAVTQDIERRKVKLAYSYIDWRL